MSDPIRTARIPSAEAGARPLLRELHEDGLQAAVVTGFYPADVMTRVVAKLQAMPEHPLWQHRDHPDPQRRQTRVLGQPTSPSDVHPSGADPHSYFADAVRFRELLQGVFGEAFPFEECLSSLLQQLSGGAGVEAACDGDGRPYGLATVRCMPRGFGLPPHCENDYIFIPIHNGLRERVQLPKQLSFFMLLGAPEEGGELVIHQRRWSGPSGAGDQREFMREPHEIIAMAPGDLVLFPAGRVFHSVLPARGERARWTLGGFGAYSNDDSRFLRWA